MAENIITYILDLQENITGKLKQIGISNEQQLSSWAKVQKQVNSANNTMQNMGNSIGSMNERIAALKAQKEWIPASNHAAIRATNHEIQKLEREITKLNTLDGGKMKKWFGDLKSSIPAFVNPLTASIAGIGKVIKTGMDAEVQKVNLKTLFQGDEKAAAQFYDKISQYAIKTPYEKTDLIEGQKTMMSFGISAEKSFNTLQNIGDIAMGDSQKMQALTLAFSQATSSGKLQGQDLMQMINAGFNPLQVISERTGESISSLKDKMSKGKISAENLSQAFRWATDSQGLFYKGAEKASQTLSGKFSNLMDSFSEMAINLYDKVLSPLINPIMDFINLVVNGVSEGIDKLINGFKDGNPVMIALAGAIGAITAAYILHTGWQKILAAKTLIVTFFKSGEAAAWWAATVPMLITVGVIAAIIAAIVAVIAAIVYCVKHVTGWGDVWDATVSFMKNTFYAYVEAVKLYFTTLVNGIMIGIDKIKLGWYKFKEAMGIGDSSENQAAIAKINADVEARQNTIIDGAKKVADYANKAKHSFDGVSLKTDGTSIGEFIGGATKKLGINGRLQNSVSGGDKKENKTGKATNEAIATGGTRNTTINIKIDDMIKQVVFNGTVSENVPEIERKFAEALYRVLGVAETSTAA